jgi:DNA polymerase III alpha subunit|tara:strand:- start:867 stop:1388 length:522 start_codon:yes stop_codon:yes gene_type:complete
MAEKTKINDHGDVIFSEEDAIDLLYTNPEFDISKLYFDDVEKYSESLSQLGIDLPVINTAPKREKIELFDKQNCDEWHMPNQYYDINVLQWLLEKCQNDEEKLRVQMEYDLFEKKNFIRVLQFLIYFIDTLRANNIVWGVGRGSSVASFCLFLIGVHKINPMLYNLDITEFLR